MKFLITATIVVGWLVLHASPTESLAQQVTVLNTISTGFNVDRGGPIGNQDDTFAVSEWVSEATAFGPRTRARYYIKATRIDFLPFDYHWPVHNGVVEGRMPLIGGVRLSPMVWSVVGYGSPGIATSTATFDVLNCGVFVCGTFYTVSGDADYHVPLTLAGNPAPGDSEVSSLANSAFSSASTFQPLQTRSLVEFIDENDQTEAILAEFVTTVEQLPSGLYEYVYEAINASVNSANFNWLLAGLEGDLAAGETATHSFVSPLPPMVGSSQAHIEFFGFDELQQSMVGGPVALLTPVPEPSSCLLALLAASSIGFAMQGRLRPSL